MRTSFLLHMDSLAILDKLNNEQAGQLLKAMHNYHLGKVVHLPFELDLAFHSFEQQFSRDKDAYTRKVEANKANGLKGGRPKAKEPSGLIEKPKKAKKAYSDSDSDSNTIANDFTWFWSAYPKKVNKGTAEKAFNKLYKELPDIKKLIELLELKKNSEQWKKDTGKYIPYPSSWLNAKGWEDEEQPVNNVQQGGKMMGGFYVQ